MCPWLWNRFMAGEQCNVHLYNHGIVLQTSLVPGPTPQGEERAWYSLSLGGGAEANFKQCYDTIIQYLGALH